MIPNVHTLEVFIYLIKVKSRPMYLSGLRATSLPTKKPLSFLVNVLTFIEDQADIRIREKFKQYSARLLFTPSLRSA